MYGPCTRPVYTTRVHDCERAVCTDVFDRVHGAYTARTRDVYTAMYGLCTRHVYGRVRVYVSTRTRAVYTAVYGPFSRAKTCSRAVYTAAV